MESDPILNMGIGLAEKFGNCGLNKATIVQVLYLSYKHKLTISGCVICQFLVAISIAKVQ